MLLISPSCLENRNFSRSFPFLSPPFTLSSEGVGNNEAKAELCVIYINDYIAVSHLFAWASMVVLWKSYIILVPLPRQLRKRGAFMFSYIVKVLWPGLCSSIQPFATNLSFILHDRTYIKTFSYKSMPFWKFSGWKHFLLSRYVFIHN